MRPLCSSRRSLVAFAIIALVFLVRPSSFKTTFADDPKADAPKSDDPKSDDAKGGDKEKPEKSEKVDEAPALVTAEKGAFSVVLELDATLDARESVPVDVHTDTYSGELEPKSAPVLAPMVVKQGDVLATFDTEKIDDQIASGKRELEVAKVGLLRTQEESRRDESESARTLARAKIEMDRAVEALEYFTKTDRAKRITESEIDLKASNDSVTDQVEELEQLKKMYKADDVVEETEKIVMARSERSLDRSRKYLVLRQESHDRLLKVELPRELEDREDAARHSTAEHAKFAATLPLDLEKTRKEIAKSELDLALQTKNLAKLEKDRARFELRAPVAGLAVPGILTEGKWSGGEEVVKSLRSKEGLKTHQVLFTLLPGSAFVVRMSVPESSILDLAPGKTAEVRLACAPTRALVATVSTVGRTSADGKFDVVLDLTEKDERWMPGFAAKVKLTAVTRADAITVPEDSVVAKGDVHRVFLWVDGKSVAREVDVGATSAGRTEIVKGLDAGAKVLESPPK